MNTHGAAAQIVAAVKQGDEDEARRLLATAWQQGRRFYGETVLTVAGIAADHMDDSDVQREISESDSGETREPVSSRSSVSRGDSPLSGRRAGRRVRRRELRAQTV